MGQHNHRATLSLTILARLVPGRVETKPDFKKQCINKYKHLIHTQVRKIACGSNKSRQRSEQTRGPVSVFSFQSTNVISHKSNATLLRCHAAMLTTICMRVCDCPLSCLCMHYLLCHSQPITLPSSSSAPYAFLIKFFIPMVLVFSMHATNQNVMGTAPWVSMVTQL